MQKRTESSHRELILAIVRRSDRHPTADDVFMSARAHVPSISLTTVYRNLRRLVTLGELRERMFGGVSRFDAHLEEHGHLVCTECGAIVDIAADGTAVVRQLGQRAQAWEGAHVDGELQGRCPPGRRKASVKGRRAPAPSRRARRGSR